MGRTGADVKDASNILVLTGLPQVDDKKVNKLKLVLLKKFQKTDQGGDEDVVPVHSEIPCSDGPNPTSLGYAFFEFATALDANRVLAQCRGGKLKLDQSNILNVFRASDFARLASLPDTYTPPSKEELCTIEAPDRYDWLLEGNGRDIFSTRGKTNLALQYVDLSSLSKTERYHTIDIADRTQVVRWSPYGTFLVLVSQRQGMMASSQSSTSGYFEVRTGSQPRLRKLFRKDVKGVLDAAFSPRESFLLVLSERQLDAYDVLTGQLLWQCNQIPANAQHVSSVAQFSVNETYLAVQRQASSRGGARGARGAAETFHPAPLGVVLTSNWTFLKWADAPSSPPGFAFSTVGSLFAYWTVEEGGKASILVVDPDLADGGAKGKGERFTVVETKPLFNLHGLELHWSGDGTTLLCGVVGFRKTSVEAPINAAGPRVVQTARNTTVDESSIELLRVGGGASRGGGAGGFGARAGQARTWSDCTQGRVESLSWQKKGPIAVQTAWADSASAADAGAVAAAAANGGQGSDSAPALFACVTSQAYKSAPGSNTVTIYEAALTPSGGLDVKQVASMPTTGGGVHKVLWCPHGLGDYFVVVGQSASGGAANFVFSRLVAKKRSKKDKEKALGAAAAVGVTASTAGAGGAGGGERAIEQLRKDEMGEVAHYSWSPSGRYFAAAVTMNATTLQNGVRLWSVFGEPLCKFDFDELWSFDWRPRMPSFLSERQRQDVERTLASRIEKWRQQRGPVADPQEALQREKRDVLTKWHAWRKERRAALKAAEAERYEERGMASCDEEEITEEVIIREIQ